MGAIRESLQAHRKLFVRFYVVGTIVLVAAAVLGEVKWGNSLFFFTDLPESERPGQGAFTAVSSISLGAAAVLVLLVARQLGRTGTHRRYVWRWQATAAGLAVLSFDEILLIHEWVAYRLEMAEAPKLLGIDHDLYVWMVYGIVALWLGWGLLPSIMARRSTLFPLAAMVTLFIASEATDLVPWDGLSDTQKRIFGPTEEILKTLGSASAVLYAFLLLEHAIQNTEAEGL